MSDTLERPLNGHQRRRAATRAKVLDAAKAILAERGASALTIVDVAAAAGVSQGTVYKIFANREELVLEAVESPQILGMLERVAARPASEHPLRRLLAGLQTMLAEVTPEDVLLSTRANEHEDVTLLGARLRLEFVLIESFAEALRRDAVDLSHQEATLWSSVFIGTMRAVEMVADPDWSNARIIEELEHCISLLLCP